MWPGVSSAVRRTRPSSIDSPSPSGRNAYSALALAPRHTVAPVRSLQLQMAGEEIGVQVGQHDVRDPQPVLLGKGQVLLDVALRIDDRGDPGQLVADQ